MMEITDFLIHLLVYVAFIAFVIHMLMKAHVIEEVAIEVSKIKEQFETLNDKLINLTNSINNKLMIDESKARAAVADVKAEEKTII